MSSKIVLFVVVFAAFFQSLTALECKPSKIECLTWDSFRVCVDIAGNATLVGDPLKCPAGTVCNDATKFPCVYGSPPVTTRPPVIVLPPTCTGPGKFKATKCEQYYECVAVLYWWEPSLLDCPLGMVFNEIFQTCEAPGAGNCGGITAITEGTTSTPEITEKPLPPPTCSKAGKFPATCTEYYECVQQMWWWEAVLRRCLPGFVFNAETSDCEEPSAGNCGKSLTTTPTSVTTKAPVSEPDCFGPGNHTAFFCNQYYQCESYMWWWVPVLKACPRGLAFEEEQKICVVAQMVGCSIGATTSSPNTAGTTSSKSPETTTTTKTTTSDAPVTPPACFGDGNFTAPECDQYYQCISVWWWWEPRLLTCPPGLGFSSSSKICEDAVSVGCKKATFVPSTSSSTPKPSSTTSAATTTVTPSTTPKKTISSSTSTVASSSSTSTETSTTTDSTTTSETTTVTPSTAPKETISSSSSTVARSSSTSSETSTTKTITSDAPVTPPACFGDGNYTAPECDQYYQCISVWWWWEPRLLTCPPGLGFSSSSKICEDAVSVGCKKATTGPPECTEAGKYPTTECDEYNQYYECGKGAWEPPDIVTCPPGLAFNSSSSECEDAASLGCQKAIINA